MPARAIGDPVHELGIWLPLALADIYTTMLVQQGLKEVPSVTNVLRSWQLDDLSKALSGPTTAVHKTGGEYGGDLAAMFAKELK